MVHGTKIVPWKSLFRNFPRIRPTVTIRPIRVSFMIYLDESFFLKFCYRPDNSAMGQSALRFIIWTGKVKFFFPSASLYHLYQHTKSSMTKALHRLTFKKWISQTYIMAVFTCRIRRFPGIQRHSFFPSHLHHLPLRVSKRPLHLAETATLFQGSGQTLLHRPLLSVKIQTGKRPLKSFLLPFRICKPGTAFLFVRLATHLLSLKKPPFK